MSIEFSAWEARYLSLSELEYELRIRKLKPKSYHASKVKALDRAVAREVPVCIDPKYSLVTEIEAIEASLTSITTAIIELDEQVSADDVDVRRIKSRLVHITQRIERFPPKPAADGEQIVEEKKETWLANYLELESDLLEKVAINAKDLSSRTSSLLQPSVNAVKGVPVYK
ncbi:hypothetical protein Zmor_028306 [Zophobas morio]|uniref:Uncharacterized protein n=1 Tax=Zophobas morio TaxID=2755281 RepID=A0AA38HQ96_9CUCU|nr:hypothetical protein Zmor_028306 [Zophobas morio]